MEPENGLEARDYIKVVRRQRAFILLLTLMGGSLALAYGLLAPPSYSSVAEVLVKAVRISTDTSVVPPGQLISMETERGIASSVSVAELASKQLGNQGPRSLLERLIVEVPRDSQILRITFQAATPEGARDGAQAFAVSYLEFKVQEAQQTVARLVAAINRQVEELEKQLAMANDELGGAGQGSSRFAELLATRDQIVGQIALVRSRLAAVTAPEIDPGAIIASAGLPASPQSPRPVLYVAIGLFLGLLVGLVFGFARDRSDDRVRGAAEVEEALGAPVVGIVPPERHRRGARGRRLATGDAPVEEAYRRIAAGLLWAGAQERLRTLVVVGSVASEEAWLATANVALHLALSGKRVALIEANVRTPRLHQLFGLSKGSGFSSVLEGAVPLQEALRSTSLGRLSVLPGGPVSEHASEALTPDAVERLVAQVLVSADIAVIDLPPVLDVADAVTLAPLADGIVVITDARHTTRATLSRTRREFLSVGARVVGAVILNLDPADVDALPNEIADRARAVAPARLD